MPIVERPVEIDDTRAAAATTDVPAKAPSAVRLADPSEFPTPAESMGAGAQSEHGDVTASPLPSHPGFAAGNQLAEEARQGIARTKSPSESWADRVRTTLPDDAGKMNADDAASKVAERPIGATESATTATAVHHTASSVVVVAVDDTAVSQHAFEYTLEHLLGPNDVLVLVHVYEPFSFANADVNEMGYVNSEIFESLAKEHRITASRVMLQYTSECERRNIKCLVKTWEGEPKSGICTVAEQLNAKMLVVGTNRRNALVRLFIGSVSDYAVHNCNRPVTVIASEVEIDAPKEPVPEPTRRPDTTA